jgi:2-polyprenyl-3-methyl-5-hydroxy-6-metoxy-1,4-benzoquinol methylase
LFEKEAHQFFACNHCGLLHLHPQPTDATLGQIYGKKYYNAWGVQHDAARVLALKKATFARHVLPAVTLPPGANVLDCGAAFGTLMDAAADQGWQPYGIELATEAAAEIASRFGADHVYSGPFEQAAFPHAPLMDAVFMCDFIEHVRDPRAVFQQAARLLRPGGQLVLTTPDGGSLSRKLLGASWPHYKIEHLHYFNRTNIVTLLAQAGFKTQRVRAAHKVLNFDYVQHQFNTYPRPLLTPAFNAFARVTSDRWRNQPRSFSLGEMLVHAIKA